MSFIEDNKDKLAALDATIEKHINIEGPLMPVLHKAQELFGCLSEDVQNYIAGKMNIPVSDIYGVATFYSQFRLVAPGEFTVSVCLGTACYVKGAQGLIDEVCRVLKCEVGKTTEDGKFTIEATRCLGCCGLAPVMMIGEDVYGNLDPKDIEKILRKY